MAKDMTKPDPSVVLDLLQAFRWSKTMFAAVSLGVFDALKEGPLSVDGLAGKLQADRDALGRLLDCCVGLQLPRPGRDRLLQYSSRDGVSLPGKSAVRGQLRQLLEQGLLETLGEPRGCGSRREQPLEAGIWLAGGCLRELLPHGGSQTRVFNGHAWLWHDEFAGGRGCVRSQPVSSLRRRGGSDRPSGNGCVHALPQYGGGGF